MNVATEKILRATLKADGSIGEGQILEVLALLQAKPREQRYDRPALLTQAAKARQLGVSRFTVRELVRLGRLHPIELLPGLLRYRAEELVEV